jgi:beta-barrel assembly-enhancing protease
MLNRPARPRRLFIAAVTMALVPMSVPLPTAAANPPPRLGNSADSVLNRNEEYRLGLSVYRQLLEGGVVLDDPLINDYLQDLGQRIVAAADNDGTIFTFFAVDEGGINAFAIPGGFVGINRGLIDAANAEGELAGVLAHEVAHVLQRHFVRRSEEVAQANMLTTVLSIAGLVLSAGSNSRDATTAIVYAGQSAMIQNQINFTREYEYEADRVGIGYLADAGLDVTGMADFFDALSRRTRITSVRVPEFLRTHPVSTSRINEARGRERNYELQRVPNTRRFALTKARVAVMSGDHDAQLMARFEPPTDQSTHWALVATEYGRALTLADSGRAVDASEIMAQLLRHHDDVTAFHIGLADAQLNAGHHSQALVTLANANRLFPRSRPVTLAYFEALMAEGQPDEAHDLLLDLLNNISNPTPPEVRRLAQAAGDSGELAEGHGYMAEYNLMLGDFEEAVIQLTLALRSPELDEYQTVRFEARLDEITAVMPQRRRRVSEPDEDHLQGSVDR